MPDTEEPGKKISPPRAAKKDDKDDDETERGGGWGWVLAVVVGLAAIAGLFAFARMSVPPSDGAVDIPLCTIMIEVPAFDWKARAAVDAFERDLRATGVLEELGPASPNMLYVLPAGAEEVAYRQFKDITEPEWPVVFHYMQMSDWFVPRFFRLDGTACVIRVGPKQRFFDSNVTSALQGVIDAHRKDFTAVHAYSRLGGIGEAADRDAINVTFGVQWCWVKVRRTVRPGSPPQPIIDPQGLRMLEAGVKPVLQQAPARLGFRGVASPASWATYVHAVRTRSEREPEIPADKTVIDAMFKFARDIGVVPLTGPDGVEAMVEVTTTAEGRDNVELEYWMGATFQESLKNVTVSGTGRRFKNVRPEDEKR